MKGNANGRQSHKKGLKSGSTIQFTFGGRGGAVNIDDEKTKICLTETGHIEEFLLDVGGY